MKSVSVRFPTRSGRTLKAVDEVSLDIHRGEAIGIVGESGSGKSMLALSLLGLVRPPGVLSGKVDVAGRDVLAAPPREIYELRGKVIGLILQDPTASLNPVRTIRSQLAESARRAPIAGSSLDHEISEALIAVGLKPSEVLGRYPFELSGGMNQRVVIAMALIQRPQILIADEPTTALDVSTQLGVLALLQSIQKQRGMTLVLISHDLALIYQVTQRIAVMYAGKLVELGATQDIVERPIHPYTKALIAAIPRPEAGDRPLQTIPGQLLPMFDDSRGCPFADRCPEVMDICRVTFPKRSSPTASHSVWCWLSKTEWHSE